MSAVALFYRARPRYRLSLPARETEIGYPLRQPRDLCVFSAPIVVVVVVVDSGISG